MLLLLLLPPYSLSPSAFIVRFILFHRYGNFTFIAYYYKFWLFVVYKSGGKTRRILIIIIRGCLLCPYSNKHHPHALEISHTFSRGSIFPIGDCMKWSFFGPRECSSLTVCWLLSSTWEVTKLLNWDLSSLTWLNLNWLLSRFRSNVFNIRY